MYSHKEPPGSSHTLYNIKIADAVPAPNHPPLCYAPFTTNPNQHALMCSTW
jgi:hypothetical protein